MFQSQNILFGPLPPTTTTTNTTAKYAGWNILPFLSDNPPPCWAKFETFYFFEGFSYYRHKVRTKVCSECLYSKFNHIEVHKTEMCPKCGLHVAKPCLKDHLESHDVTTSYKNGLVTKTKSKKRKLTETQSDPVQPRLNSFHVYCRAFREAKKQQFPQLDMIGINQKLSEDWHKLTPAEKEAYKPSSTAAQIAPTAPTVPAPTVPAEVGKGQMTILKCNSCGRMFFNQDALDNHKSSIGC